MNDSRRLSIWRWTWIVIFAFTIGSCTLALITSCSHLTVAPKPVEAHAIALGETNKPDADIIDGDASGLHVRKIWVDQYFRLEAKFKEQNWPGDDKIAAEKSEKFLALGSQFTVPYKCSDHFADMKRRERLAEAGP